MIYDAATTFLRVYAHQKNEIWRGIDKYTVYM